MSEKQKVVVVMPAYNAARTLERTYRDIPPNTVDGVILVDDVSKDETVEIARQLGLRVIIHLQNRGYGGNQKSCFCGTIITLLRSVARPNIFPKRPQLIFGEAAHTAWAV